MENNDFFKYLDKINQSYRRRKILILTFKIFAPALLVLFLAALLWGNVFYSVYRPQETFSYFKNNPFKTVYYGDEGRKLLLKNGKVEVLKKKEYFKLIKKELFSQKNQFNYTLERDNGSIVRGQFIDNETVPHFDVKKRVYGGLKYKSPQTDNVFSYFTNGFKGIIKGFDKNYYTARVYTFITVTDIRQPFFYVLMALVFIGFIMVKKYIYAAPEFYVFNGEAYPNFFQVSSVFGAFAGFFSAMMPQNSAMLWSSGFSIFTRPNDSYFSTIFVYLPWAFFILFSVGLLVQLSDKVGRKFVWWFPYIVLSILFFTLFASGSTFIMKLIAFLFSLFFDSVGGWSGVIEAFLAFSFISFIFSPGKFNNKSKEELTAYYKKQNQSAKKLAEIQAYNQAASVWNQTHDSKMPLKNTNDAYSVF